MSIKVSIVYWFLTFVNWFLAPFTREQNEILTDLAAKHKEENGAYGKISSVCPAAHSNIKTAKLLDKLLVLHEQEIKDELTALYKNYQGLSMIDFDPVQKQAFGDVAKNWKPIWIKFMDTYSGVAKELPRLTSISKLAKADIWLLHISGMNGKTYLAPHRGVYRGVWRYHYPLYIPAPGLAELSGTPVVEFTKPGQVRPPVGMQIDGTYFHWSPAPIGGGVLWDDTLEHSSWNMTDFPRFVIFADIQRQFSFPLLNWLNRFTYRVLHHFSHMKELQAKLKAEGKSLN